MRILTQLVLMVTAIVLCIFYSAQQVSAKTFDVNCNKVSSQFRQLSTVRTTEI